jgi:hypothetical protein
MSEIHSCSYYCTRPACVLAQRNELRDKQQAAKCQPGAAAQSLRADSPAA